MRLGILSTAVFAAMAVAYAEEPISSLDYDPAKLTPEMRKATDTIAEALEGLTPEGYTQKSLVERYTPINMYDKIDGRSELFHAYNVSAMTFVTYSKSDDINKFFDVFLYDMTTPLGAYGVFSVERWPGYEPLPIGDGGYQTENSLYFRKGQYYASITGADDDEALRSVILQYAKNLAQRLKGEASGIWGLAMFPEENRIDDTVQYLMVDALGLDFLTNTFTATYRDGDNEYTAFVADLGTIADADAAIGQYGTYLKDYGDVGEPAIVAGHTVMLADVGGGYFDGACRIDHLVVGVTAVEGRDNAVASLSTFIAGLKIPK